jgi:hypothetical protein
MVYMYINFFFWQWRGLVLNLGSCEYWCAVLTSRPPGQSADISVRTELKLFFSCAVGSSMWGLHHLFSCCPHNQLQHL